MSDPFPVVIAGSRSITDFELVREICEEAFWYWRRQVTEIVSGRAPGVDTLGEQVAEYHHIPLKLMPAEWDNITVPGAVVRTRRDGKQYNIRAGHMRNEEMAVYSSAGIIIWDGKSNGTMDMFNRMKSKGKPVFLKTVKISA